MAKLAGDSGGAENRNLRRRYEDLRRDWDDYKQSIPPTRRGSSTPSSSSAVTAAGRARMHAKLFRNSPGKPPSSPQGDGSPAEVWGVRSVDWDSRKIVMQRKTMIGGGKFGGKRLLEMLEAAVDGADDVGPEEKADRSASPSFLTHGQMSGAARSPSSSSSSSSFCCFCCCCSCSARSSSCSSPSMVNRGGGGGYGLSSSSLSPEHILERGKVGKWTTGDGGRGRTIGMAGVISLLLLSSICAVILMNWNCKEDGDFLFPT